MNKNLKKILNDSNYITKQIFDRKENEREHRLVTNGWIEREKVQSAETEVTNDVR